MWGALALRLALRLRAWRFATLLHSGLLTTLLDARLFTALFHARLLSLPLGARLERPPLATIMLILPLHLARCGSAQRILRTHAAIAILLLLLLSLLFAPRLPALARFARRVIAPMRALVIVANALPPIGFALLMLAHLAFAIFAHTLGDGLRIPHGGAHRLAGRPVGT